MEKFEKKEKFQESDIQEHNVDDRKINKKIQLKIFDYPIWKIWAYFVIYSIGGYLTETVFGILTKGVIESRKSMLYGPFCCIYGMGAIFLICMPKKVKKNKWSLFCAGIVWGSIIEYFISWVGDYYYHMKWWDYSNFAFNINGRICLLFSIFWGILAIVLNRVVNPKVDKIVDKIPQKPLRIALAIVFVFLVIDEAITSFALRMFFTKIIYKNNIEVQGSEMYYEKYLDLYQNNEKIKNIVDKYFSDETMLMTFPNIKLTLKDGNVVLVRSILKDIKPYYIRLFTPKNIGNIEFVMDY